MDPAVIPEDEAECIVCMELVSEKKQCMRPCGHMMCLKCDAEWRCRGNIEKVKMVKAKETFTMCITVTNCPMCRRKDQPEDYKRRSKESLYQELQLLSHTLILYGITKPAIYVPSSLNDVMDSTRYETPVDRARVPIARSQAALVSSPVTSPVAPVLPQVILPQVILPQVSSPVVTPVVTPVAGLPRAGSCCNRQTGCTTVRTKLRCRNCYRLLCRSCQGSCVCR